MSGKGAEEKRKRKKEEALEAAEAEAEKLREILRLKRDQRMTYRAAMKVVGLELPHATLHDRLRRLQSEGAQGLVDHRRPPPTRLTPEIRGFIEGVAFADREQTTSAFQRLVAERFQERFSLRTIQQVLHDAGLSRPPARFTSQLQPAS